MVTAKHIKAASSSHVPALLLGGRICTSNCQIDSFAEIFTHLPHFRFLLILTVWEKQCRTDGRTDGRTYGYYTHGLYTRTTV
jgi:hypothetical protein